MPAEPRIVGFAAVHDAPVPYIQRTREYYLALGFGAPYEWAHYAQVPFQPLRKPLSECRLAIVTTAAPYKPSAGDQGPGAPYNAAAKFYAVYSGDMARDHDLRISHVAIDRTHTTAEDSGTYFPLPELRAAVERGRVALLGRPFPWPADEPKPSDDPRDRLPRDRGAMRGGRCRRGHSGAQLSCLPPECQPCCPYARGERDRHGRDGVRQGYRRVCRRSPVPVFRFSARQFRGQAGRSGIANLHA